MTYRKDDGIGTVYLVGAGPGDPDLITVKGLKLLRRADVVLFDRLASDELLNEARPDAELIDVGKTPYRASISQDEINALLVEKAQAGLTVVRLKGGDPFVFGRGGEEALACYAAGVRFEVVPGVSSAIAAPAYAGIPVTHRHMSTGFTVFTGHEDPNKDETSVDYEALARVGTLVLMMGLGKLAKISERLQAAGLAPETPAVCIEWASTDQQRVIEGTLATIAALVSEAGFESPATTVIGAVAALPQQGLRWFKDHEIEICS
ncbi:MAG: uroporphyrinogen-III C-methyltransferase [Burkholderiales bacterium]|nr:uroporphyrinogen-III C-methyltransferase [Anaerolineae bacterium]